MWEFQDSGLLIWVHYHSRVRGAVNRAELRSQVLFAIWDRFKALGITLPSPQRDVHLKGSTATPQERLS